MIERVSRPVGVSRMRTAARRLLDAAELGAIATVTPRHGAYVNTAYFAWGRSFELVWLSEPRAQHSRNVAANGSVAVAVYDSRQAWEGGGRGIQLFGTARGVDGDAAREAETLYQRRFPQFAERELAAYRFYVFRPRRVKLFDEGEFGAGVFVTARVAGDGGLTWQRTEVYRGDR